jgi:hypothetical protein
MIEKSTIPRPSFEALLLDRINVKQTGAFATIAAVTHPKIDRQSHPTAYSPAAGACVDAHHLSPLAIDGLVLFPSCQPNRCSIPFCGQPCGEHSGSRVA